MNWVKALWNGSLGHQMETLPQFEEAFRAITP
jgi:hypothetical protein